MAIDERRGISFDEQLQAILKALHGVKLLPRRAFESGVIYGYIAPDELETIKAYVVNTLARHGYEVHRCDWRGEAVLLALNNSPHPLAIRLTSSADERYNLYVSSRPTSAQALWQWAHAMQGDSA